MATMQLRPRGFSELIDATFEIVRARFRVLATTAALIMVPVMAFTLLSVLANPESAAPVIGGDGKVTVGGPVVTTGSQGSVLATILVLPVMVAAFVAYVMGFGAMMYIASRAYMGEAVEMGPAMSRAKARFWTLVRATIAKYIRAMGPVVLIGVVLAVLIPALASGGGGAGAPAVVLGLLLPVAMVWGVVLLLRYAVTGPVVLNEQVSGSEALRRSATLTKGSKGRLFGLFALLFVIMYAVMLTVMFVTMMIFRSVLFAQVLMNVASLVTYPFAAVLMTVIYYDLRIRNEGFDLEVMAGGLTDGAAAGALPSANAAPRQHA